MTQIRTFLLFYSVAFLMLCPQAIAADGTIRIGFNFPLTGGLELAARHGQNAAELLLEDIKAAGGLRVGDKVYDVEYIYGNNDADPTKAANLVIEQVSKHRVLAMIGPLSSKQAVPVGQMANAFSTVVISPWSTVPKTTEKMPFSFRSCFVYTDQTPILTKFADQEYGAKKGAVLFNATNIYSSGMAKAFIKDFEEYHGPGAVVANEQFRNGDTDFRAQIKNILLSGAEVLFLPQQYYEVPTVVEQMIELGLDIPILGTEGYATDELLERCGANCNGVVFTSNYLPGNAQGINKTFVEQYSKAYDLVPDEPAALTWDAMRALFKAIKDTGGLTGNLIDDRVAVQRQLAKLRNFEGATGMMSFNASGNPDKCIVVGKIVDEKFTTHDSVCP
ncbi:ABC transporter substrate-binding protein [Desulfosediminicola ganghwensis]|uniref:ABC transporter substrate-binding protein n=1 Tax=Desulfosediminicola ganghwensis TaxID=2569540 RepID=UPI0010AB5FE6|nr:ABC transporter substrate-binding protein [Desulfosediminicola ganghwensis]